jgi:pimeloyl-ACP methyl ester carboxylesterase
VHAGTTQDELGTGVLYTRPVVPVIRLPSFLAMLCALGACRPSGGVPGPVAYDPPVAPPPAQVTAPPVVTALPGEPAASASAAPAEERPAKVERIAVPGDSPASIVRGKEGFPRIVFLPGLCANAYAYLLSFPGAAHAHGGAIALEGDRPCGAPDSGYRSLSWDPVRQDKRIGAALAAAGATEVPAGGLTLVGYSAGAAVAELMVQRWPERYARVVLIGAPSDPLAARLARARGVVMMSCTRDVPARMKNASRRLLAIGVPATYLEMPGCTHGNIADGDRVFDTAFTFLAASSSDDGGAALR